jgi:two-component system sensor histidine kinase BaeS
MREGRSLGPIGWRVLAAFLVVALASVAALLVATVIGLDLSRSEVVRAERQAMAADLAGDAGPAYAIAGSWTAADLAAVAAAAQDRGARLGVEAPDGALVVGGPVGPGFQRNAARAPVVVDGEQVGVLLLGFGDGEARAPSVLSARWFAIATLLAITVALVMAVLLTGRITRPLRRLAATTRRFADDRAARADVDEPGELGELARTFNAMADEVSRAEEARRRLSADAAHELRTPLTVLQAGLEELRDGQVPAEPETLAALHAQTLRLGRVVEDLSALARAESPSLVLHRERLDLADLVSEVLVVWRPRLAHAGVTLAHALPMGSWVDADGDRVHEVVTNLLSNALRHSTRGGTISVEVTSAPGWMVLAVRDTGSGIAAEDLPYVLDRFYRGGTGRPRSDSSGLGLAVVRALVVAHGGEVSIDSALGRGTTVTVRLPKAG